MKTINDITASRGLKLAVWTLACLSVLLISSAHAGLSNYTTNYRYDSGGRLVGVIKPDPDGSGPLKNPAVRNTYNAQGLLIKIEAGALNNWQEDDSSDPANWSEFSVFQVKETTYDNEGRKLIEKLSSGGVAYALTQTSYDFVGRVDCVAVRLNPAAYDNLPDACTLGIEGKYGPDRITKNTYDTTTHVLKVQKAYGNALQQDYATYTYSRNGQQVSVTDANNNLTRFEYDGFDRQSALYFPSKTSINTASTTDFEQYTYDDNNNRKSLKKRDGNIINYSYDNLNRVTSEEFPANTSTNVAYDYDLRNLQLSTRFGSNSGSGITSSYDGFGQLTTTSTDQSGSPRTLSYQYDAEGNRTKITHPDGVFFTYAFDGLNRLNTIAENGTTALASLTYDDQGRRQTLSRGSDVSSTTYDYDPISRLQTLTQNLDGTGTLYDETRNFTYSPANQILSRDFSNTLYAFNPVSSVGESYTVNGLNQYIQIVNSQAIAPTYDDNGNMTSDGATTYRYDLLNRLTNASGAHTVNISYDPKGRLFQTSGGASGTTQFLYDGDALVGEYNDSGSLLRRYVHGSNVDEPLVWYEGAGVDASNRRYFHADHQGSVIAATDSSGTTLQTNSYDPYGIPASRNNTRFQYT